MTDPDELADEVTERMHPSEIRSAIREAQSAADWLDQLDLTDTAFAYGLLAFVGGMCFALGFWAGS